MSSAVPLVLSAVWMLVACSAGNPPSARSETDASNPNAPAGPPIVLAAASAAAPAATAPSASAAPAPSAAAAGSASHAGHAHGHQHAAKSEYVCPMHPEVTSSEPGQCPKCHMDLVPKK